MEQEFKCNEMTDLLSGLCIFHYEQYLKDDDNQFTHKKNVLNKLREKINHDILKYKKVECIGYYVPEIKFSELINVKSINIINNRKVNFYFKSATFLGKTDFSGTKFSVSIDFTGAKFSGEANFTGVLFLGADFSYAIFSLGANFTAAKFSREVHFFHATFSRVTHFLGAIFSERTVFYWVKFSREADDVTSFLSSVAEFNFSGATFFGEAGFFETSFSGGRAGFSETRFFGEITDFSGAIFSEETDFSGAIFSKKTDFSGAIFSEDAKFTTTTIFNDLTEFHNVLFEAPEKTVFDVNDMSEVSFLNTDITRVRFSEEARWGKKKVEFDKFWGGKKVKEERFKIVDERLLEEKIKYSHTTKNFNLGSIKAVYRCLRENYEYRMRYDEAGQFFIREMELKRMYKEIPSSEEELNSLEIKQNNWFKRNLFSLTGLYYHLSRYGEDLLRPTLAGIVILLISTLFWTAQSRPTLEPNLNFTNIPPANITDDTSTFILLKNITNQAHLLKAFERSIADFIPLLPLGGDVKVGVIDYVIKIVGGAVTFGLIAIALRRRFERKYRH